MDGGTENDLIVVGPGDLGVIGSGGMGDDTLIGGNGVDVLFGGPGVDLLFGGAQLDVMFGGDGDDRVAGETGRDFIFGDGGNDLLRAHIENAWRLDVGLPATVVDRTTPWTTQYQQFLDRETQVFARVTALELKEQTEGLTDEEQEERQLLADELANLNLAENDINPYQQVQVDMAVSGDGNDTLKGSPYRDVLVGEAGDDTFVQAVEESADVDTVQGGLGLDTFVVPGTAGPDDIRVEYTTSDEFPDRVDVRVNGWRTRADLPGIDAAGIDAGAEADTVTMAGMGPQALLRVWADLGDGNDVYDGSTFEAAATVFGGTGSDTITGGLSDDSLDGGDGNDSVTGGQGFDTLAGDAGNDVLDGQGGNDSLIGGDGDDVLSAGDGVDTARGSAGNDMLTGGNQDDALYGDDGDDVLFGEDGWDGLYGGGGNDSMHGGDGGDWFEGGDGDDTQLGGIGDDSLRGDAGADLLRGGDGKDVINGMTGNDSLFGDAGSDQLYGEDDDDFLDGSAGKDTLYGGAGNDNLVSSPGVAVRGGSGFDRVVFATEAPSDVIVFRDGIVLNGTVNSVTGIETYEITGSWVLVWRGAGAGPHAGTLGLTSAPISVNGNAAPVPVYREAVQFSMLAYIDIYGDREFQWNNATESTTAGLPGTNRRISGFQIDPDYSTPGLGIRYMAHTADTGDTPWATAGTFVGTRNAPPRYRAMYGFAIEVTGPEAAFYTVQYRVKLVGSAWSPWATDGAFIGNRWLGGIPVPPPVEAMEVRIVPR